MRTSTRLLALVATLLLLVAGCGPSGGMPSGAAATVDGEAVPRDQLETAVRELTADTPEDSRESATEETQRQVLTLLIQAKIIENLADAEGIEIDEEAGEERVQADLEQSGGEDEFREMLAFQNFTFELYRDVLVPTQMRVDVLREQLAADEPPIEERQVRHILVESEDEAREVIDELEAGADFGELAAERSIDEVSAQQDGELGSAPRGAYVPEFDDAAWGAAVDEIVGPIESQFGFHIIQVTDVTETPASELDVQQLDQLVGQALAALIGDAFTEADVTVDPAFGRWDPEASEVVSGDRVGEGGDDGLQPAPEEPAEGEQDG